MVSKSGTVEMQKMRVKRHENPRREVLIEILNYYCSEIGTNLPVIQMIISTIEKTECIIKLGTSNSKQLHKIVRKSKIGNFRQDGVFTNINNKMVNMQ